MPTTFEMSESDKRSVARGQDAYQEARDRASNDFVGAVARETSAYAERARRARDAYHAVMADIAEAHGVAWETVASYSIDRVKNTVTFEVKQ